MRAKATLLWVASCAGMSAFWYVLWRGNPEIASENHVMENFEAFCLVLGILFLIAALRSPADVAQKVLLLGLTLFYLTMLVLEVDTRKMNVPAWFASITNGTIRNVWLGGFWLIAAFTFLRHRRGTLIRFLAWLRTTSGALMLGSGVFWSAAFITEKLFHVSFFCEELLECNAGLLMAQSAWQMLRQVRCEVR